MKGKNWPDRMDGLCRWCASAVPVAIIMGNIAFELAVAVTGLAWIIRCVLAKDNPVERLRDNVLFLPWMAWFAAILLSLIVNGAGSKGWEHDVIFLRFPLFGAAVIDLSTRRPIVRDLVYGLAAGVIWAALNTVLAYGWGHDLVWKPWEQYTSRLKIAARIAGFTAYAVPFLVTCSLYGDVEKRQRNIFLLLAAAAFALLLFMHLRTMILASVAGLCFGVGFGIYRQKQHRWALLLVIVMAAVAAVPFFYFKGMTSLASIYDRVYFWRVSWQMWVDNPIFGTSVSAFQDQYYATAVSGAVAPFAAPNGVVYQVKHAMHAHNLPLMLLSSTGLLGLAAFTWLFVKAAMAAFRLSFTLRGGLVSWPVVLLVIGLTGANIYHSWYQALLAFFLAMLGAHDFVWHKASRLGEKHKTEK